MARESRPQSHARASVPSSAVADPAGQSVPALDLPAAFDALRDELLREIADVCASGQYVLGQRVAAFETALAAYCGARYALGLSSGTDALLVALMACGVGRGDEVIVPAFTFFATAGVVSRLGARPVFCDVDPDTFNIDAAQVEERITTRTRAVIPVHLFGQMAELRPIFDACNRHGIAVIEDAAQAIGATPPPDAPARPRQPGGGALPELRRAGAIGTMGALSFYPTKNLGAFGDAGALLTNDENLYEICRKLRVHGSGHTYHHERIGGNFRIDALQAAILRVKLPHLERWTEARRARAARYTELLGAEGLAPERVRTPVEGFGRHVYHQYVVRAARRDALAEHLKSRRIGCGVYYPLPLHLQECFADLGHKPGDFPHSERAAGEVLALPMYPELTDQQQRAVVAAIGEFYRP